MEKKLVPQCQRRQCRKRLYRAIYTEATVIYSLQTFKLIYAQRTHPHPSPPPYNLASTLPSSNPTSVVHKINVSLSTGILNLRLTP